MISLIDIVASKIRITKRSIRFATFPLPFVPSLYPIITKSFIFPLFLICPRLVFRCGWSIFTTAALTLAPLLFLMQIPAWSTWLLLISCWRLSLCYLSPSLSLSLSPSLSLPSQPISPSYSLPISISLPSILPRSPVISLPLGSPGPRGFLF